MRQVAHHLDHAVEIRGPDPGAVQLQPSGHASLIVDADIVTPVQLAVMRLAEAEVHRPVDHGGGGTRVHAKAELLTADGHWNHGQRAGQLERHADGVGRALPGIEPLAAGLEAAERHLLPVVVHGEVILPDGPKADDPEDGTAELLFQMRQIHPDGFEPAHPQILPGKFAHPDAIHRPSGPPGAAQDAMIGCGSDTPPIESRQVQQHRAGAGVQNHAAAHPVDTHVIDEHQVGSQPETVGDDPRWRRRQGFPTDQDPKLHLKEVQFQNPERRRQQQVSLHGEPVHLHVNRHPVSCRVRLNVHDSDGLELVQLVQRRL